MDGITDESWETHLKQLETYQADKVVAFWQSQYDTATK